MRSKPNLHNSISFFIALTSFVLLTTPTAHAQPPPPGGQQFTPTVIFNAQSAYIPGRGLFINGGFSNTTSSSSFHSSEQAINQTFYIDLSVSWPTSNPTLRQLPSPPSSIAGFGYTSSIYNHNRNWILGNNGTRQVFDLTTNQWILPQPENQYQSLELNPSESVWAVSIDDPSNINSTGVVYFINGWSTPTLGSAVMNATTKTIRRIEPSVPLSGGYVAVWSSLRKSILVYGGYTTLAPLVAQRNLYELSLSDGTTPPAFELKASKGDLPLARYGHCLVEAYNGTKMVLFGGATQDNSTSDDIYILDVATLTWTAGKTTGAAAVGASRMYASCAVTNDMFVAYGGARIDHGTKAWSMVKEPVVVYNLKTSEWQTRFDPEQGQGLDSGWILLWIKGAVWGIPYIYLAAGAAGLVLLFAILSVFFIFRKRREEKRYSRLAGDGEVSNRSGGGGDGVGPESMHRGGGDTRHRQAITYLYDQRPSSHSSAQSAAFVGGSQFSQQPPMSQIRHSTLYYSETAPIQIRTHDPITGYPFPQGKVQFFELATNAAVTTTSATPASDKEDGLKMKDAKVDENKTPISLDELPEKLYSHPPPELHHRLSSLSVASTATLPVSSPSHVRPEGSSEDDEVPKKAVVKVVQRKKDVPVVVSKDAVKAKNKVPLRREVSISKDAGVKTTTKAVAANKTTAAALARANRASS
ncbi:MAG: hypothetical protein J3R72DRAFT_447044 [Linnemannia gamsii]|nr:MAG: hypothetical protein J3R72DRAFT_447044 [Linnemannia gamsii]